MKLRTNKVVIKDYKNYWIESTPRGHLIKICYGKKDHVLQLDLKWSDRKRDKSGKPIDSIKK